MVLNSVDLNQPNCLSGTSFSIMENELLISEDVGEEFYNDIENSSETNYIQNEKNDFNEDFNEEEFVVVDEVNGDLEESGKRSERSKQPVHSSSSHTNDQHKKNKRLRTEQTLARSRSRTHDHSYPNRRLFHNPNSRQNSMEPVDSASRHYPANYPDHRNTNYSRGQLSDRYNQLPHSYINAQDRDFRHSIAATMLQTAAQFQYGGHANPYQMEQFSSMAAQSTSSSRRRDLSSHAHQHHGSSGHFHSNSTRHLNENLEVQGYAKATVANSHAVDRNEHGFSHHQGTRPLMDPKYMKGQLSRGRIRYGDSDSTNGCDRGHGRNNGKSSSKPRETSRSEAASHSRRTTPNSSKLPTLKKSFNKRNSRDNSISNSSTPRKSPDCQITYKSRSRTRKVRSPLLSPTRVKEAPLIDVKREIKSPTPERRSPIQTESTSQESPQIIKKNSVLSSDKKGPRNVLVGPTIKQEPTNKISDETFRQAEQMGIDVTYLLEYKANEAEIKKRREEIEKMKEESRRQRLLKNAAANSAPPINNVPAAIVSNNKSGTLERSRKKSGSQELDKVAKKEFRQPKLPIRKVLPSLSQEPSISVTESPSPSPTKKRRVIHSLNVESASVIQNLSRNITNDEAAEQLRLSLTKRTSRYSPDIKEIRNLVEVTHLKPFSGLKELESLVAHYFDSAIIQTVSSDKRTANLEFQDKEEATDFVRRFNGFKLRDSIIKVTLKN